MIIETIDPDGWYITIDTDDLWGETFAYWDRLVSADRAAQIATALVDTLIRTEDPS